MATKDKSATGINVWQWILENWQLGIILVLVLVLRMPNFYEPYWYGDEGIYLTVGQAMVKGSELYAEIVDHKTPMIYWISAWAFNLYRLKLVLLICSLASVFLFYFLAKKWFSSLITAGVLTLVFGLATTLPRFEGHIANGELLLMPLVLLAIYLFWRQFPQSIPKKLDLNNYYKKVGWVYPVIVGGLFGLAILTKVPSGFELAALGMFLIFFVPFFWQKTLVGQSVRYGLHIVLGAMGVVLATVLYFWMRGTVVDYLDFGLLYNFRYIQSWGSPFSHPAAIFLATMPGRLLMLTGYLIAVYKLVDSRHLPLRYVLVWLGLSMFAATLSLRPYPHYFIQVMPAFILALGFTTTGNLREKLLVIGSIVGVIFVVNQLKTFPYETRGYYENFWNFSIGNKSVDDYMNWFDYKTSQTYDIAGYIQERTLPYERIYIHGSEPMVYALAERSPASKYTVHFHVESIGAYEEVMRELDENKPKYILDYIQDRNSFKELYTMLDVEYIPVEEINRAIVYKRLRIK